MAKFEGDMQEIRELMVALAMKYDKVVSSVLRGRCINKLLKALNGDSTA